MKRVLMGDFAALLRLGYRDVLGIDGIELLETDGADVVERLVDALPDVVVLDADDGGTEALVERLVHEFPALKVISCSSEHPAMRVFPPLHYGESYTTDLEPALLTSAIQT